MAGAERMTIEEVVRRGLREEHGDVIRESVRVVARELMEAEVSELVGAAHGERTEDRATHRNGCRSRRWDTRAGEIELQIPKIRQGSYFPSFPAAQKALRAGARLGRAAGLRLWRLDSARRSARREPWPAHQQVGGEPDRGAAGRAGAGVPGAAVGGPLPVSVRRRQGAPRGAVGSGGVRDPAAGPSQRAGEAEGSLAPELRGAGGSSPDNDGTRENIGSRGPGKQGG